MLYIYDMVEASPEAPVLKPEPVLTVPEYPQRWPQPRLQQHDFSLPMKVVLPPSGLPH